jgi:hypothetical protein
MLKERKLMESKLVNMLNLLNLSILLKLITSTWLKLT